MKKELEYVEALNEQSTWEGSVNIKFSSFVHYFGGQPSKGWLYIANRFVSYFVQKQETQRWVRQDPWSVSI